MVGPLPEELEPFSPAARHIYDHLRREGPCTHSEIVTALRCKPRTVTRCTDRLCEAGVVERTVTTSDARERVFQVSNGADS